METVTVDKATPEPSSGSDIFARLVETVSDIVTLLSPEGDVLYQSPSITTVLGYRQEDRVGANIFRDSLVHPNDVEAKRTFLADIFRHHQTRSQFRLRHVDGSWRDMEAVGVLVPALGGAVATYRDVTDQRRQEMRQKLLAEAGKRLSGSLYIEATLTSVARLAVPAIADWCIIDLLQEDGTVRCVAIAHSNPEKEIWAHETAKRYFDDRAKAAAVILEQGEARLIPQIPKETLRTAAQTAEQRDLLDELDFRSLINVPLMARGRPLGVLTFATSMDRVLDQSDLNFAQELASHAALAIDNARLYQGAETARLQLQDLFMEAPALICVTRGPDHVFELVNPRMRDILGNREFVGQPAREVPSEVDGQGIHAITDHVYQSGEPFVGNEMPLRLDRDGDGNLEQGYFNFVFQPTRDVHGKVDGVMVHGVEVTDEVTNRQRVERLAAERDAILSQMVDGVVIVDRFGTVVFMNDAAERMYGSRVLGYDARRLPETIDIQDLEGAQIEANHTPLVRALAEGEATIDAEIRIRRPDGHEAVLQRSATPVTSYDGTQLGAVMTIRDVTAIRTLETQKDEFLAAIAHDLRTPLTAIKGHAQVLLRRMNRSLEYRGKESDRVSVARIDSTASRMTALVNELLDVTSADMHRPVVLSYAQADVVELVREAIADHGQLASARNVDVSAEPDVINGVWDGPRLRRSLSNLIGNALHYSAKEQLVRVTLSMMEDIDQPLAVVKVEDHGTGIPAKDLPCVFDRFFRGSNVSANISGTGLGLTSARQIIERHGGKLTIESVEGEGTTCIVRLPIAPPTSA